ncbi:hypothetical protein [Paracoccus benzoatiresistens]|uniref:Uncharacterized protein n=1 Tax=Paracoccus benzoatiresistens TaxID=2997341 RepID=A0ABT4JBG4_9RHOB|nr:hypothetical protein [Paracoccus sp. EF6]MCZ0964423.1 hypothetical protein [Paracoccus sp. EF6]
MGRAQQLPLQGDLLTLMEPGPMLTDAAQATVAPLLAALLLEAVETQGQNPKNDALETGGRDEQDRV